MKSYYLLKKEFFGMPMKKVDYYFNVSEMPSRNKFIRIIVHHTGSKQKTIQNVLDLHVLKNKWSGIGYHFMIGKNGVIYSTRSLKYAGAHTYHHNRNSIGIALFGNFDEVKPTEKQIESLEKLVKVLKKNYLIKDILGHNEAIYKYFKGKYFKYDLPDVNPIEFRSKKKYDDFIMDCTTKVLENESDYDAVKTIKRLKSCPGFYMYSKVRVLKKLFV